MMKKTLLAAAFLVAGMGIAGSTSAAIPGCESGDTGLPSYGWMQVCLLEYDQQSGGNWDYEQNMPVQTYLYQQYVDGRDYVRVYANGLVYQYEYSSQWSSYSTDSYATRAYLTLNPWARVSGENVGTSGGVTFDQYGYHQTSQWGDSDYHRTYLAGGQIVYVPGMGYHGAFVYYQQWNVNNQGCMERAYMREYSGGSATFTDIVPEQSCTHEVQRLPALPHL